MAKSSRAAPVPTVTIVVGSEDALISRAIGRVVRVARAADPQAEHIEVLAKDPGAAMALAEALAPGLFAVPSVVVVRGAQDAPQDVVQALCLGLSDLPAETWVVVVHAGGKNAEAVLGPVRAATSAGSVAELSAVAPKRGRATRAFLAGEATAAGARISDEAIDVLTQATGPDLGLQLGALAQIIVDSSTPAIGIAEVNAAFSGVSEVAGYELADSVWERQPASAMAQLSWGWQTDTLTGPAITGALAASLRQLVRVATAPRGMSDAEVGALAGVRDFKLRQLRQQVRRWRPEQLAAAVVTLSEADAGVKGGLRPGENLTPEQKQYLLARWILATVPRAPD
ncbi:MAG: DNA polymerase III subunit delta [Candidatus Nanopelagicales bacterium]